MSRKVELSLLLFILLLGGFFRFYKITSVPSGLYPDEAMNGNNALEAIATGNFKVFYPENNGREGLFINLQALSVKAFGNEPWALRVVSAVFGTLTILGIYLLAKELFGEFLRQTENEKLKIKNFVGKLKIYQSEFISLLSAFFIATNYWHINFSRTGFRAIAAPFFAVFGVYFLLKGIRLRRIRDFIWAGIFTGLGFHTYISFRFMPFVFLAPLASYLATGGERKGKIRDVAIFLSAVFIVALPLGMYFLKNPADFFGRVGQVSVFSSVSPAAEFLKSNLLTLGMFFVRGDCNWRHNYACNPALYPSAGFFLIVGAIFIIKKLRKRNGSSPMPSLLLLTWLVFMSFPATLTRESVPHALRSIGMIPPVMILAGLGSWWVLDKISAWLAARGEKQPRYLNQIKRIQKEVMILFILMLLIIPLATYRLYFSRWAESSDTSAAFSADILHIGQFLNNLPADTKKYVVVNLPGTEVRGIPMPAQTVMFATDTFTEKMRTAKNLVYILPQNLSDISVADGQKTVIAFLNGGNREIIYAAQRKFPEFKIRVPGDFAILAN